MEGNVCEDADVLAEAEEGVDVGLAIIVMTPVEVKHQEHGDQAHLEKK